MRRVRQGIIILSGIALSGCQTEAMPGRTTKTVPVKPKVAVSKPATPKATTPIKKAPVYIDLGPIETVALPSAPITVTREASVTKPSVRPSPVKIEQNISPSEAVLAEQLRPASEGTSALLIKQASGELSDRCDPIYWGGQTPPANLRCNSVHDSVENTNAYRSPLPGTYIRLAPKSELQLNDAEFVVREIGNSDTKVSDDVMGAILLVRSRQQNQPQPVLARESLDDGRTPELPLENVGLPPSVLLPDS